VRIADLYRVLASQAPSPIVELNRAVAVSMAFGPAKGASYHLLPSVRGDLLAKLGRDAEARADFERGASLTRNAREKAFLLARAARLA